MSYTVTVTVTDGKAETHLSGQVPDGRYVVAGHREEGHQTLSVTRYLPDGHQAGHAGFQHTQEK